MSEHVREPAPNLDLMFPEDEFLDASNAMFDDKIPLSRMRVAEVMRTVANRAAEEATRESDDLYVVLSRLVSTCRAAKMTGALVTQITESDAFIKTVDAINRYTYRRR